MPEREERREWLVRVNDESCGMRECLGRAINGPAVVGIGMPDGEESEDGFVASYRRGEGGNDHCEHCSCWLWVTCSLMRWPIELLFSISGFGRWVATRSGIGGSFTLIVTFLLNFYGVF